MGQASKLANNFTEQISHPLEFVFKVIWKAFFYLPLNQFCSNCYFEILRVEFVFI